MGKRITGVVLLGLTCLVVYGCATNQKAFQATSVLMDLAAHAAMRPSGVVEGTNLEDLAGSVPDCVEELPAEVLTLLAEASRLTMQARFQSAQKVEGELLARLDSSGVSPGALETTLGLLAALVVQQGRGAAGLALHQRALAVLTARPCRVPAAEAHRQGEIASCLMNLERFSDAVEAAQAGLEALERTPACGPAPGCPEQLHAAWLHAFLVGSFHQMGKEEEAARHAAEAERLLQDLDGTRGCLTNVDADGLGFLLAYQIREKLKGSSTDCQAVERWVMENLGRFHELPARLLGGIEAVAGCHRNRREWSEAMAWQGRAMALADALFGMGNLPAFNATMGYAEAEFNLGRRAQALARLESLRERMSERMGVENGYLTSLMRWQFYLLEEDKQYEKALAMGRAVWGMMRRISEDSTSTGRDLVHQLALLAAQLERAPEAAMLIRLAAENMQADKSSSSEDLRLMLEAQGKWTCTAGNHEGGLKVLQRALALALEVGPPTPEFLAESLYWMVQCFDGIRDEGAAGKAEAEQCLSLYGDLGLEPDRAAACLASAVGFRITLGKPQDALSLLEEWAPRLAPLVGPDRRRQLVRGQAGALRLLGKKQEFEAFIDGSKLTPEEKEAIHAMFHW
jgi:tetratricopeptide (TPR) repeat protein